MRNKADRILKFKRLCADLNVCEYAAFDYEHTKWVKSTNAIVFTPSHLIDRDRDTVLRESAATLLYIHYFKALTTNADCKDALQIHVDCRLLTDESCRNLWYKSSWKQIRTGFKLFTTFPLSITRIVIINPHSPPKYWFVCVSKIVYFLPFKLKERLVFLNDCESV